MCFAYHTTHANCLEQVSDYFWLLNIEVVRTPGGKGGAAHKSQYEHCRL